MTQTGLSSGKLYMFHIVTVIGNTESEDLSQGFYTGKWYMVSRKSRFSNLVDKVIIERLIYSHNSVKKSNADLERLL